MKTPVVKIAQGMSEVDAIRKKLKHVTVQKQPQHWLIPPFPELAEIFGDPKRGIPYGKIYEICGRFSGCKTAITQELAAMAQSIDNAEVGWIDLEASYDEQWAQVRGLDTSRVALFQPEVIEDKKGEDKSKRKIGGDTHIESAEEIFSLAEYWIRSKFAKDPLTKIFMAIDSTVAILPKQEDDAGLENKARGVLAAFLSKMLRRWAPIVRTHNVMLFLINQLRINPGVAFGDPEYRPGGQALDFYTSVITKVKRSRGKGQGWIYIGGERKGVKGIIVNQKNKTGGEEAVEIGYKIYWNKRGKFLPASVILEG